MIRYCSSTLMSGQAVFALSEGGRTLLSTLILSRETSISGELICGKQQKIKEKRHVLKNIGSSYFALVPDESFQDDFNMIKMSLVVNITQEDRQV